MDECRRTGSGRSDRRCGASRPAAARARRAGRRRARRRCRRGTGASGGCRSAPRAAARSSRLQRERIDATARLQQVHRDASLTEDADQLAFAAQHGRLEVERRAIGVRQQRQDVVFGAAPLERGDELQDADRRRVQPVAHCARRRPPPTRRAFYSSGCCPLGRGHGPAEASLEAAGRPMSSAARLEPGALSRLTAGPRRTSSETSSACRVPLDNAGLPFLRA